MEKRNYTAPAVVEHRGFVFETLPSGIVLLPDSL